MNKFNTHKSGMAVGLTFGVLHLVWSILVAGGAAQPLADFVFKLHMISPVPQVLAFNLMDAIGLVLITSVVGYLIGFLFATVWNYLHQK